MTKRLTDEELAAIKQRAERSEDAEFIAHAREDVPRLIAEIRRLRKALEWIYEMQDLFYVEEIESDFGTIKKLPEHLVHISGPLQSLFLTVREALKGGN